MPIPLIALAAAGVAKAGAAVGGAAGAKALGGIAAGTAARVAGPAVARGVGGAAGKIGGSMARNAVPYMMGRMSAGGGESDFHESRNDNFSQGTMSSTSPESDRARLAFLHGLPG
jgi:hypothetical protein